MSEQEKSERKKLIGSSNSKNKRNQGDGYDTFNEVEMEKRPNDPEATERTQQKLTFHQAAKFGNAKLVQSYLNRYSGSCDVNLPDRHGVTALYYAVKYEHMDIVKMLIYGGADSSFGDPPPLYVALDNCYENLSNQSVDDDVGEGFTQCCLDEENRAKFLSSSRREENVLTFLLDKGWGYKQYSGYHANHNPLINAARKGNLFLLSILIGSPGVDVEFADGSGTTALHAACEAGNTRAAKMLMAAGASIRSLDSKHRTPLHYAAIGDGSEILKETILDIEKHDYRIGNYTLETILNHETDEGKSILHITIEKGDCEMCSFLIEKGANVNLTTLGNRNHSLHLAAIAGNVEIFDLLLKSGGDIEVQNRNQDTPLHKTAEFNHSELAAHMLLSKNCHINSRNIESQTPLFIALIHGNRKVLEVLLENGADISITDNNERNVIIEAVERNFIESLKIILTYVSKLPYGRKLVNYKSFENSALHIACEKGCIEIVQLLIQYGADIAICNVNGETPLQRACQHGQSKIVELLLNQDNCVITKVSDYQRLITIAASKNNDEIIEMVMSKCSSLGMIDKASAITSSIDGAKRLLLEAAQSGDLEFLRRLVNLHHADTTHGDLEGITVLSWAIISSHRHVVLFLLSQENWLAQMKTRFFDCFNHTMDSPMRLLIKHMPDVALMVLNRCITTKKEDEKIFIRMNYELMEDTYIDWNTDGQKEKEEEDDIDDESSSNPPLQVKIKDNYKLTPMEHSLLEDINFHPTKLMCDYKRSELLEHPLVRSLINEKWHRFGRNVFCGRFILYVIFLFILTGHILIVPTVLPRKVIQENGTECIQQFPAEERKSTNVIFFYYIGKHLITFTSCIQLVLEILQIVKINGIKKYIQDPANFIEGAMYFLAVTFAFPYSNMVENCDRQIQHISIGACAIFLAWINLLLFIQKLPIVGIYVVMFIHVTKTFIKFSVIFILFLVAFSLVFYILLGNQHFPFNGMNRSFMKTFVMMIGEFDFDTIFNDESLKPPPIAWLFFFLFLIVMTILLMNVTVGLAVDDIKGVLDMAELNRTLMLVDFLLQTENYLRFIKRRYVITSYEIDTSRKIQWYQRLLIPYVSIMESIRKSFNISKNMEINIPSPASQLQEQKEETETIEEQLKKQNEKIDNQLQKQNEKIDEQHKTQTENINELKKQISTLVDLLKQTKISGTTE